MSAASQVIYKVTNEEAARRCGWACENSHHDGQAIPLSGPVAESWQPICGERQRCLLCGQWSIDGFFRASVCLLLSGCTDCTQTNVLTLSRGSTAGASSPRGFYWVVDTGKWRKRGTNYGVRASVSWWLVYITLNAMTCSLTHSFLSPRGEACTWPSDKGSYVNRTSLFRYKEN